MNIFRIVAGSLLVAVIATQVYTISKITSIERQITPMQNVSSQIVGINNKIDDLNLSTMRIDDAVTSLSSQVKSLGELEVTIKPTQYAAPSVVPIAQTTPSFPPTQFPTYPIHPPVAGKPVIYLYPTSSQIVDITLTTEQKLLATYPRAKIDNHSYSWQINANPTGEILIDGKSYSYGS